MTAKITALDNHQLLSAFIDHYPRVYHDLVFKGVPMEDAKEIAKKDFLKHMEKLIPAPVLKTEFKPERLKKYNQAYVEAAIQGHDDNYCTVYAHSIASGDSEIYAEAYATSMVAGNSHYYSTFIAQLYDKDICL